VIFTSGGTESANLALRGYAHANAARGRHLLVGATEHAAVLRAAERLEAEGFAVSRVPVDAEGLVVAKLPEKVDLILVAPSHQFPLGVTMTMRRRLALIDWARRNDAWIVEDDYDSEFRYQGKPLPALKSLDRRDRVLYVGTFSKVLSPGLRVGYLVLPPSLVGRFTDVAQFLQPPPAHLIQLTIAEFMEQGYLARHIRRMRQLYAERRAALADALSEQVPALRIDLKPGGMHLLTRLPRGTDDVRLVERMKKAGLSPSPLSISGVERPYAPGLVIGFTNIDTKKARSAAQALARGLQD